MYTSSLAVVGLIASAVFSQAAFATEPKGEYLGKAPVDLTGEIQIPAADLGVVVTYLEDGSVYAYQAGLGRRALMPRGCWGIQIGPCCIGVYCSAAEEGANSKREVDGGANPKTIQATGDPSTRMTALTVYPDSTMDISVEKLNKHGVHSRYTCIGVHVGGCCLGLCIP